MTAIINTAEDYRQSIYVQLDGLCAAEVGVGRGYIRLGVMLLDFKQREVWQELGYASFDAFMGELVTRYQRGRTALYSYLGVAEKLLPIIDADSLEEMGIGKAMEIKRALKHANGKAIPEDIITDARLAEKTIADIRADLAKAFNIAPLEKGRWYDLQGFYMTPEEWAEFVACVRLTKSVLEISNETPDHIQRHEIFMAWMREFKATYEPQVNAPQEMQNTPAVLLLPGTAEKECPHCGVIYDADSLHMCPDTQ